MSEQEKAIALQIIRTALDVLQSLPPGAPIDKLEISPNQRTVDINLGKRQSITISIWDFNPSRGPA